MSLNRRACRPFLARLQPGKVKYAWISDDTLISALRPFLLTRSCRRHVGLAPGPLEARKRATRRRLMGLAPSGTAPPAGDIASHVGIESWLFGRSKVSPQTYQWQEPSAPIRRQFKKKGIFTMLHLSISKLTRYLEKAILPLWLTGADPAREQTPKIYSNNAGPSNSKVLKDAMTEHHEELRDPQFRAPRDLEHCSRLVDIRRFIRRELGRTIQSNSEMSSFAIQCLLEKAVPLERILKFLENTGLNTETAKNAENLLTHWLQKATLKTGEDEILFNWIQTQVILGFLPFQDISSLMEIINSLKNSGLAALNRELFYAKLIEGVRRCTVCGSMSMKENMLDTIFLFISSGEMSPTMVSLGWDITRTSSRAHCGLMNDKIGSFVSNCLLSQVLSPSSTALASNAEDSIAIALKNIRAFPEHLAEAFIQSASEALIMRINDSNPTISGCKMEENSERKRTLEQLDRWWTSLQDCGILPKIQERPSWQIVEHALGSQAYDVPTSYLQLMGHRSKCLFFIRHCFQSKFEREDGGDFYRTKNIRANIEAQFKDICEEHPGRSPFANLLLSIRLESPRHSFIIYDLFDIVRSLGLPGTLLVLVKTRSMARVQVDTSLIVQEINYYLLRNEKRLAYRIFQLFPFVPLEYVPALAQVMIENPNLCTHTAFYYRHSRQKWIDQVAPTNTDPQSLARLRTDLLNDMAFASARSPHSLGVSFRQVYKCYLALKTDRLPVTAKMTRALTVAGIVKYQKLGRWVSMARYNMIWALVREVEGQEVADRLDDIVYIGRGKVLDEKMYRKRMEPALSLPHGDSLSMEQQVIHKAEDMPKIRYTPSKEWKKDTPSMQWVQHGPRY